eukprot:snap_masked-scaffold_20-processed-gene-0.34-mRNA-1 protein AED:0.76 eAED:0.77 QI:0/-1/0/1/-1/1/1/0/1043
MSNELEFPKELIQFIQVIDLFNFSCLINDHFSEEVSKCEAFYKPLDLPLLGFDTSGFVLMSKLVSLAPKKDTHLAQLILKKAKLTSSGLNYLSLRCNLKILKLHSCSRISDSCVSMLIENSTKLEELSIINCKNIEGDCIIKSTYCCPSIYKLVFKKNKLSSDWIYRKISTSVFRHSLREIDFSWSKYIVDEILSLFGTNFMYLQTVRLDYCDRISDLGVSSLCHGCRYIQALSIKRKAQPTFITDTCILSISQYLKNLQTLCIQGNSYVSDAGLKWLADGCPNLIGLNIAQCSLITNYGISYLVSRCTLIEEINLSNTGKVSNNGLTSVATSCPNMKVINLSACKLVHDKGDFGLNLLARSAKFISEITLKNIKLVKGKFLLKSTTKVLRKLNLSNTGLEETYLLQSISSLQELDFLDLSCTRITERSILVICSKLIFLKSLNISSCERISSKGFSKSFQNFKLGELRILFLSNTYVGDVAIDVLCNLTKKPVLHKLYLDDSRGILTDTAVIQLSHCFPSLAELNVKGCNQVSKYLVRELCSSWTGVQFEHTKKFLGFIPDKFCLQKRYQDAYLVARRRLVFLQSLIKGNLERKKFLNKKLMIKKNIAATKIQTRLRIFFSCRVLGELRVEKATTIRRVTLLQACYRRYSGIKIYQKRKIEKAKKERRKAAISFQVGWRGFQARKILECKKLQFARENRLFIRSVLRLQCRHRQKVAEAQLEKLKQDFKIKKSAEIRAALRVQKNFRGKQDRNKFRKMLQVKEQLLRRRNTGAIILQHFFKGILKGKLEKLALKQLFLRGKSASCIQNAFRVYRGKCHLYFLRRIKEIKKMNESALLVQRAVRRKSAYKVYLLMQEKKQRLLNKKLEIVIKIQNIFRGNKDRKSFKKLMDNIQAKKDRRTQLEVWASVSIQRCFRGFLGRKQAAISLEEKLRCWSWKELETEERQRYYFNPNTGEVRWRKPQILLDLEPRPLCSDGELAVMECRDCSEFYCEQCFGYVHSGGKRIYHEFRSLYDYFGRRIDYGEGEWPSTWPTELLQEEETH